MANQFRLDNSRMHRHGAVRASCTVVEGGVLQARPSSFHLLKPPAIDRTSEYPSWPSVSAANADLVPPAQ